MRSIFFRTRGIGARLVRVVIRREDVRASHDAHISKSRYGAPRLVADLGLGGGEAGGGEDFFVEGDEDAFGAGKDGAVGTLDFGLVEELAIGGAVGFGGAVEMAGDKDERLIERHGAEVIDLHVAGHGEDVEGAVKLAHGLVEECGDDAAVNVAGRAFMHAVELDLCGGGDVVGVGCVGGEGEVEALGVGGAASEAVIGALVDGGGVHRGGGVAGGVGCWHGF
jgi:hypothetical protein